jgi:ABC-2 type transport system ATP-binding protein
MASSARPVIDVSDLYKSYGDVRAVQGVSYEVFPGEIFAVLGPNGAGKTTTMRMTLGLIKPDRGTARVFGEPVTEKLYPRIGYLPEERGLYQDVTVLECLTYLGSLKGLSAADARKRALAGLERVELPEKANEKVKSLSRGMQQKVQFLVTILHDPELIIIDEPFSGLDPVNTRLIESIIYDLAAKGTAVVMSTHQMRQIEEMADRLMMVSSGQRVLYGPVDAVRQEYATGSVLVKATGNLETLQGVDHIIRRNGQYELFPLPGVTPQELLRQLAVAPNISVEEFEVATPSLDDIFVAVVKEKQA